MGSLRAVERTFDSYQSFDAQGDGLESSGMSAAITARKPQNTKISKRGSDVPVRPRAPSLLLMF
jgi:hypothetical protein